MAKFDFSISPDFIKALGSMQDIDKLAPQMIDSAIPILEGNVKGELSKHRRTGSLANSVKSTKAKQTKNGGYYASVHPTGSDEKGVRNMEKAVYLEYGTSDQPPTPTLTKALKDSESEVIDEMQRVFTDGVNGE